MMAFIRHASNFCKIRMQRMYSTTAINTKEADEWIAALDAKTREEVTVIQSQVAKAAKYVFDPTPVTLDVHHYQRMLEYTSNGRQRYFRRLHGFAIANSHEKKDQVIRQFNFVKHKAERDNNEDASPYSLSKTSLFMNFRATWTMKWEHLRMATSIYSHEPKVIFDCGFNHTMGHYDQISAARQIRGSIKANRKAAVPFVMHFCNLAKGSPFWRMLEAEMAYLSHVPMHVHEQDIAQVIAPERLVYLSPNSEHVLEEFNPNDCYVIGSIVDRGAKVPLTLDKATKLNVRTARLPIDRFVTFRMHKELNLDHVMRILLTAKDCGSDWQKQIIHHIPRHKYNEKPDNGRK